MVFEIKQNYETKNNLIEAILNTKNLLTLSSIILFFIAFFIRMTKLTLDESFLMKQNGEKYIDTYSISNVHGEVFLIECLLFAAVSVKLCLFLKLNDYIRFFYSTLERGLISFLKYSLFFLLIITGYTIISYIIWGSNVKEFSSFGSAFIQILLFSMGKLNKIFMFNFLIFNNIKNCINLS